MSKFKIKLKLQGLDIEIEGAREDIPAIAQNISAQLSSLIEPAARIVEGEVVSTNSTASARLPDIPTDPSRQRGRSTRRVPGNAPPRGDGSAALDWSHDVEKWGTAQQGWTTAKKAMWLLYIVSRQTNTKQISGPRIAATFNKHFKQAGPIIRGNVSRDLGKLKSGPTAPVSEDTTQSPSEWFLTQQGEKEAAVLVNEALGRSPSGQVAAQ